MSMSVRLIGRLVFVVGFVLSIYGLGGDNRRLVNAGLALLLIGVIATAVSLYLQATARRPGQPSASADRERPD